MCPEEDYSTVVETLAIDVKIRVGIEETKNQALVDYLSYTSTFTTQLGWLTEVGSYTSTFTTQGG